MEELRKQIINEMKELADEFVKQLKTIEEEGAIESDKVASGVINQYTKSVSNINQRLAEFAQRQKETKKKGFF